MDADWELIENSDGSQLYVKPITRGVIVVPVPRPTTESIFDENGQLNLDDDWTHVGAYREDEEPQ